MYSRKMIGLVVMLTFLSLSQAYAGYLEPLGGGQTYGCEPGTKSVFKHSPDGTNTRLTKKRVKALISRYENVPKKKKLYKDLKACINGKLKFRNPCEIVGAGNSGRVGANVINGRLCTGDSPFVVKVTIQADNGNTSSCSGIVVHPKIVLTSAHCFSKLGISYSYLGTVTLPSGSYTTDVAGYYGAFQSPPVYDTGFLAFNGALPGVEAIPLISKGDTGTPGEPTVIAGFGYAEDQNKGDLIAGYTRIKSVDSFSITTSYSGYPGESSTCLGDSGGPLLIWRDSMWKVLGITSDGSDPNCGPNTELYFTYVREANVEDMLADSVCYRVDNYGAPDGECPFQFKNIAG